MPVYATLLPDATPAGALTTTVPNERSATLGNGLPVSQSSPSWNDDRTEKRPPVEPGDVIANKYVVERVLAVGGMGVVVAARHKLLDTPVALKFVHAAARDKRHLRRLMREGQVVARMKSPHVVRVYDVALTERNEPYIVMELLEGRDLQHHLDLSGPLPVGEAVSYLIQACEALAEAHAQGVVHRDLKPSNLFLTASVDKKPLLKLLDFGVSKPRVAADKGDTSLTRPLDIVGTPAYMSPEQLRAAKDVDGRSDIWALGVILYELLTGMQPFETRGSVVDLCATIVRDPPRPLPESLPLALRETVMNCLVKSASRRIQKVSELAAALAPFAESESERLSVDRILRMQPASRPPLASRPDDATIEEMTPLPPERGQPAAATNDEEPIAEVVPHGPGPRAIAASVVLALAGIGALTFYLARPRVAVVPPPSAPRVTAAAPPTSAPAPSVVVPRAPEETAAPVADVPPAAQPTTSAAKTVVRAAPAPPRTTATPNAAPVDPEKFLETR